MSGRVSAEIELRLVVPRQVTVPLAASFFYCRDDPYAIRIAFHGDQEEPVEWTFARDLLAMGIAGHEGVGDVRVWPSAGSEGGEPGSVLNIELCSPFGQVRLEASVAQISEFIGRTYEIVPAGEESDHLNVEAELSDLLRRGD
jgi:hypothetical protein